MGFFLNGEPHSGYKQHLNLSRLAWSVIETDIHRFYGSEGIAMSTFLNRIFTNFFQISTATISVQMLPAIEQLDFIFEMPEAKRWVNVDIKTKVYETVISLRADEIFMKVTSYPKGEGRKFRVNHTNRVYLEELNDDRYYNNNVGVYLKAVFEDYTRRPYHEREAVFYRDQVRDINEAIDKKHPMKVGTSDGKNYWVNPYSLCLDTYSTYNYLTGYMQEYGEGIEHSPLEPKSLRLTDITDIKILHTPSGRITEAQRMVLERLLNEHGPTFATDEKCEVVVHLDPVGFKLWQSHVAVAPKMIRSIEPGHLVFYGTENEVKTFFSAFGIHAKVLSTNATKI